MPEIPDLLPCPFCGTVPWDDFEDPDGAGHLVECTGKDCPINPSLFMDHEGEDIDIRVFIAERWNSRATAAGPLPARAVPVLEGPKLMDGIA